MKLVSLLLIVVSLFSSSCEARTKPLQPPARTFTSYRTNSISQKSCVCSAPSSCSCCEIVTIFYTGDKKKLCFNMAYQNNGLSFDLALDSLIIKSTLVTNYKPMEMCSAVPGVLFSSVCVNILQLDRLPNSIHVCPRVQVSSKKERWQISYSCSQLSKSASTTSDAATTIAPATTVQLMLASTMTIQPTSSSSSAATKPMATTSQETTSTTTSPKPTSMPAGAALVLQMPGIPVMAIMPGVSSMAISMGQMPSGQKPMLQVTSGKTAAVPGQMTISMSGAKVNEAASTSPKPNATIKTTTLKPGGPIMTLIGQIMPRPGSVASTFQSFDLADDPQNSTRSPMGKRAKRNTDWFDLLHQSNRCERAYKICVTRSKHYVISKLKRPRLDNGNGQSVDCSNNKNPVKIVNGNSCNYPSPATIPTTPRIPIMPTPPRPVIHEPNTIVTNFSEALDAIIIQDSEASGESSDFYPQHGPYVVPIPPQRPAKYPNRIPPLLALQMDQQQIYKDANTTFSLADLY
ncbi:hypothetical protein TKK_0014877 [Trichogramma kaykai]|uniref:DUF4773 domain-containing protein n=2 Tax=Trichogramma kaykai TaxID=54128 RepID=A0ABD2WC03_9HYME